MLVNNKKAVNTMNKQTLCNQTNSHTEKKRLLLYVLSYSFQNKLQ